MAFNVNNWVSNAFREEMLTDKDLTESNALSATNFMINMTREIEDTSNFTNSAKKTISILNALGKGESVTAARGTIKDIQNLGQELLSASDEIKKSSDNFKKADIEKVGADLYKGMQLLASGGFNGKEGVLANANQAEAIMALIRKTGDFNKVIELTGKASGKSSEELRKLTSSFIESYYGAEQSVLGSKELSKEYTELTEKYKIFQALGESGSPWNKLVDFAKKYKTELTTFTGIGTFALASAKKVEDAVSDAIKQGLLKPELKDAFKESAQNLMMSLGMGEQEAAKSLIEFMRVGLKPGTEEMDKMARKAKEMSGAFKMSVEEASKVLAQGREHMGMTAKKAEETFKFVKGLQFGNLHTEKLPEQVMADIVDLSKYSKNNTRFGEERTKNVLNAFSTVGASFKATELNETGQDSGFLKKILETAMHGTSTDMAALSTISGIEGDKIQEMIQNEKGLLDFIEAIGNKTRSVIGTSEEMSGAWAEATSSISKNLNITDSDLKKVTLTAGGLRKTFQQGKDQKESLAAIAEATKTLGERWEEFKNVGIGFMAYVGTPILNMLTWMVDIINTVAKAFGEFVGKSETAQFILKGLGAIIGTVVLGLMGLAVPLKIISIISTGKWLFKLLNVGGILKKIIPGFNKISGWFTGSGKWLGTFKGKFKNAFTSCFSHMKTGMSSAWQFIVAKSKGGLALLKTGWSAASNAMANLFKAGFSSIKSGIGMLKSGFRSLFNFIMTNPIIAIAAFIAVMVVGIINHWDELTGRVRKIFDLFSNGNWIDGIWELVKLIYRLPDIFWETIIDGIFGEGTWQNIKDTFNKWISSVWGWITGMFDKITGVFDRIPRIFKRALMGIKNWFFGFLADLIDSMSGVLKTIGLGDWVDKAKEWKKEIADYEKQIEVEDAAEEKEENRRKTEKEAEEKEQERLKNIEKQEQEKQDINVNVEQPQSITPVQVENQIMIPQQDGEANVYDSNNPLPVSLKNNELPRIASMIELFFKFIQDRCIMQDQKEAQENSEIPMFPHRNLTEHPA